MTWGDLPLPLLRRIAETTTNHVLLEELCEIEYYASIRLNVIMNEHASPSILTKLLGDQSYTIRAWAEEKLFYIRNDIKWTPRAWESILDLPAVGC